MTTISASILNADLTNLANAAAVVEQAGADLLHYDVMDGCFVDNISFGLPVLNALRSCTALPIDAHLMIREPLRFVERFVKAGADLLSFHIESDSDAAETIREIHACGIHAGVALSPDTPTEAVFPLLKLLQPEDFILLMTVQPGLGGQAFLPYVLPKIETLYQRIQAEQLPLHIEVDGGIAAGTGKQCREAGADYLVSGSYIFRAADPHAAVQSLR